MIGSNHFYLSIKATSNSLLKVLLRCISCIIIDILKWRCSCVQMAAKSIFIEQLLIYQKSVTVVITVFQFLLSNYYHLHYIYMNFMNITIVLLMIYYHHCNRLDQSCATEWISSDIFQVLPLTYNIFHTYLSNIYAVLLWHIQSSTANRFKVLRVLLLIYSLHYYWYFHITATIMLQWFSSNVLSDIFLVRLLIYALYCRW